MHRYLFIIPVLCLGCSPLAAQKFFYTHYQVPEGLPANQVRSVIQDTIGFIWIATDGGLVRFDGRHFMDYTRFLDSRYIRSLVLARSGRLLLASDTGIHKVDYRTDTAFISPLIPGGIIPSDSTLLYPNTIYEDTRARLWIGQPNARVALWEEGKLRFFVFDEDHRTGDSRSTFSFAEDPYGKIWMCASTGQCYFFDEAADRMKGVSLPGMPDRINDLAIQGDTLWIAGNVLTRARITEKGTMAQIRRFDTNGRELNCLVFDGNGGNMYAGTAGSGLFRVDFPGNSMLMQPVFGSNDPHRVEQLPFANINRLFVDATGSIWLSSDQGLGLLQSRFFKSVFGLANNNTYFIYPQEDGSVLLSFGDVYELHPDGEDFFGWVLPDLEVGFISSMAQTDRGLWVSTSDGELFLYGNGRVIRKIDLSDRGSGIFYLHDDSAGAVWFCQAPDENPITGVGRLMPDGRIRYYDQTAGIDNRMLVIKESARGRIYTAGIGPDTYLYRYQPEKDAFINLSMPLPFTPSQGFEVHDIDIDPLGIVWLATTDGLLRFDLERIQRVDLGTFTSNEIRAVAAMPDGSVWVSTDTHGLIHYQDGHFVIFDENSGLPTKVTAYRCLTIDRTGRLWVGTAEGTVHSRDRAPAPLSTPAPVILSLTEKDHVLNFAEGGRINLASNSGLGARFVSPVYPGANVEYQHRLLGRSDTSWSVASPRTQLFYGQLQHGNYLLEIRAQQKGGFNWSRAVRAPFHVRQEWYKSWWAVTVFFLFGATLLYYVVYLNIGRLVRRIRSLEGVLADQTAALQRKDRELEAQSKVLEVKEQNLAKAAAELSHQQEEIITTMTNLQLLHHLIRQIPEKPSWGQIIGALADTIEQTNGISAFEIGFYQKDALFYHGYDRRNSRFTRRSEPFDDKSVLAVWSLVRKEPVLIGEYRVDQSNYIEPGDDYRFNSAIFLPFELSGRQQLVLCIYSIYKNAFEQQDLMLMQLLTDYLSMAATGEIENRV